MDFNRQNKNLLLTYFEKKVVQCYFKIKTFKIDTYSYSCLYNLNGIKGLISKAVKYGRID